MTTSQMQIGLFTGADCATPIELRDFAVAAEANGFASIWVPQTPFFDALTGLAFAAGATDRIELGTGVVPIQTRHPATMAQQALTVAAAAGDRVCLGIGATHAPVSEGWWGVPYKGIVDVVREHVEVVAALLNDRQSQHVGANYTARMSFPDSGPTPQLVLAALGPKMLAIAGELCAGTFTWMTGPRTLAERTIGPLSDAASAAGRPAPRVIAGLPICLTNGDEADVRSFVAGRMAYALNMPSYKRAVDWEGVSSPDQIALVGDALSLRDQLAALEAIGVTDFCANITAPDSHRAATMEFLATVAAERPVK